MIDTLLEAIRATSQPCTFLLVAPPLLTVVALRAAWWSVGATFAAAIAGGWMLAANAFVLDGRWLQMSGAVVAATVVMTGALSATDRLASPTSRASASIAVVVTLLASMWWRPCVGEELGQLLTAAQTEPIAQLPGLAVYMIGTMLPVLVVTLTWRAIAPSARTERAASAVAAGAACLIALALTFGQHDAVVVKLTHWASATPSVIS